LGRQPAVLLYGDHRPYAGGEDGSQGSSPRPDLEHDVPGRRVEGVDDLAEDIGVAEEVLAEPLVRTRAHTLRMTTVRSSEAAASPRAARRRAAGWTRGRRAGERRWHTRSAGPQDRSPRRTP